MHALIVILLLAACLNEQNVVYRRLVLAFARIAAAWRRGLARLGFYWRRWWISRR